MTKRRIMSLALALLILISAALCTSCKEDEKVDDEVPAMLDPINDNYRTFYQIFVGSFSDSNGDGCGDLRGIINRFDYLNDGNINSGKSLGVQGIWLSPIFSSPSYHKYDARDYYKIDSKFGDEATLKELIDLCHERNVKIILDLAINHTSTQHPWFVEFKEARKNLDVDNEYYDYYTCVTADERVGGRTYRRIDGSNYYYECNFSDDMPELDYDNPEVREAMLDVAKYYLALGIDGFRFDAIKYIYFGDTEKSVEFWEWYMEELRKIEPEIYCVGECWSGETEILDYYSAMDCFNFATSGAESYIAKAAKGNGLSSFLSYIAGFQDKVSAANPNGMPISFLSNHDMDRIAGTFISENNMRMAANLYLLSPGSPVIYYGEEIGMRGSRGSAMTDANRRLAMLWGDGDTVKNPTGTSYAADKQIKSTVASQMEDSGSLYNYYCKLLAIRHKYPAIARGDYTAITISNNLGGFLVEYNGESILIIHNNSTNEITYDLSKNAALLEKLSLSLSDYVGVGDAKLEGSTLTIAGQTSVVIE